MTCYTENTISLRNKDDGISLLRRVPSSLLEIMKKIKLSNGGYAFINNEDFNKLSKFTWFKDKREFVFRNNYTKDINENMHNNIIRMHREVLNLGKNRNIIVDHKNGNRLDNRKRNLRICSYAENIRNSKIYSTNISGYKGVSFNNGKYRQNKPWRAYIVFNYKQKYLGNFAKKEEAALVYNKKAKELFGKFARLNIMKLIS